MSAVTEPGADRTSEAALENETARPRHPRPVDLVPIATPGTCAPSATCRSRSDPGEIVGLAGESGCGKSTLAYGSIRLLRPPAVITAGSVTYHGRRVDPGGVDILKATGAQLRQLRWREIAIVFQSAMNSLNPVLRVSDQLLDAVGAHLPLTEDQRQARIVELIEMVGIPRARLKSYPHELSGGMRQRVMIAMALAAEPEVVIMDEPTTALDVVVQREILSEIFELKDRLGFSVLFITHDLSLLLEIADRVMIMYAGRVVESGTRDQIHRHAAHPYTQRAADLVPEAPRAPPEAVRDPGLAARPPGRADRLPVHSALHVRHRRVRHGRHDAEPGRARTPDRVPGRERRARSRRPPRLCRTSQPGGRSGRARGRRAREDIQARPQDAPSTPSAASRSELCQGTITALVGESGSGKTTVARLLAGQERRSGGQILLDGKPIDPASKRGFRAYKGAVQMVFQDPFASLNPLHTVSYHLTRALRLHQDRSGLTATTEELDKLLTQVRLSPGRAVPRRLPARAVGRAAPARRDRPGAGGGAARAARRRAGLDARRLDPARDARPDRSAAPEPRPGGPVHHPRHRLRALLRGRDPRDVPRARSSSAAPPSR